MLIQIFGANFGAYGARARRTVDTARFVFVVPGISKFLSLVHVLSGPSTDAQKFFMLCLA